MAFTTSLQQNLLNLVFGAVAYTAAATIYVGLATNSTAPSADGHDLTEVSGGGYARQSLTNNATNFPNATAAGGGGQQKQNGVVVNFPSTGTASAAWGTVTYFFLGNDNLAIAGNGSNVLAFGALTTSKAINSGDSASFAANSLTITLN